MPFTKEQQREHRQKLKAKGICTVCHKNKADHSASVCQECWEKGKARRKAREVGGVQCKYCTRPVFRHGMCEVCKDGQLKTRRKRRERWIREGRCATCGKPKDDPDKVDCINCTIANTMNRQVRSSWV